MYFNVSTSFFKSALEQNRSKVVRGMSFKEFLLEVIGISWDRYLSFNDKIKQSLRDEYLSEFPSKMNEGEDLY